MLSYLIYSFLSSYCSINVISSSLFRTKTGCSDTSYLFSRSYYSTKVVGSFGELGSIFGTSIFGSILRGTLDTSGGAFGTIIWSILICTLGGSGAFVTGLSFDFLFLPFFSFIITISGSSRLSMDGASSLDSPGSQNVLRCLSILRYL